MEVVMTLWKMTLITFLGACILHSSALQADATIVYVSDKGFSLGRDETESNELKLADAGEGIEFLVAENAAVRWAVAEFGFSFYQTVSGLEAGFLGSPMRFEFNDVIAEGLEWMPIERGVTKLASTNETGSFYDLTGFLGIRVFEQEFGWEEEDALPYYGWIRIEHSAVDATLTVHDWAWNSTPGEPIQAGEIPEPATYAILVALGALGFAIVRRRRRSGRLPIA